MQNDPGLWSGCIRSIHGRRILAAFSEAGFYGIKSPSDEKPWRIVEIEFVR